MPCGPFGCAATQDDLPPVACLTCGSHDVRHLVRLDDAKTVLASLLEELLTPQTAIVDWMHKDDVQREMRRMIKKQLKVASYPAAKIDSVAESVVDLLKRRNAR